MAFDDTFRERNIVPSEEVYEMCRIKSKAEVLDLAGFGRPMSEWANRLQDLGQTIVPRTVYIAELYEQYEHRVGWVYHSWRKPDEIEEVHHIACDCVGNMNDTDEQMHEIADCPAVLAALEHRAGRVAQILRTKEVLGNYGKPEGSTKLQPSRSITAKALINFVMNYDQEHPEGWVANTMSGEHQVPLLGLLLQIEPYRDSEEPGKLTVQDIVEEMDQDGSLCLHNDGVTVSLPRAA